MNTHTWSYALSGFVLPGAPLVGMLLAWLWRAYGEGVANKRRRYAASVLFWLSAFLLWGCATPFVASRWMAFVESHAPPLNEAAARSADAVVVLAGGRRINALEYSGHALAPESLERLHYGIILSRRFKQELVLTGGSEAPGLPAAGELMRAAAAVYGVVPLAVETVSITTRDHPAGIRAVAPQLRRVIIVTSAFHMQRSLNIFRGAGYEVVSAPTGYTDQTLDPLFGWVPSAAALKASNSALRETLGLLRGY